MATSAERPDPSDRTRTVPIARDATTRHAMAHDASHYLLIPDGVATPPSVPEVCKLLQHCHDTGRHLTFRSGGTSLSGQGVTDGILVDTRKHFRRVEVLDDGARIRTGPGVTVRHANNRLLRHGRKLGPDPASEIACTIGGIVANNSSGMACGIEENAYRTLESLKVVLASGTVLDTADPDADEQLRTQEPVLHAGLAELRDRIRTSSASVEALRQQFSMKNTMGYGLNSFLDFDRPVDILTRLMVGSEGTLGFIASATFRTVELQPHAATGLAVFSDLSTAAAALPRLVAAGFATIELLDATSLTVAQGLAGVPRQIAELRVDRHAALLLEHRAPSVDALAGRLAASAALLEDFDLDTAFAFTQDAEERSRLWHVRKGLYAAVAESRPKGTTALLEDVVVPVGELLPVCERLIQMLDSYGYQQSVIFGHAKDGNVHFMLNETFDDPERLTRYQAFTEEMVDLVLTHHGSLKAEHGTGRIMAPYVRRQYGDELYDVMRRVKDLFDPSGILNPGAVLSDDPDSYVRDLKTTPPVEEEVDRCVECGYCEPVCPSKDLTLTPRQRIVLRRDMVAAENRGDHALAAELRDAYEYPGVETCAVDGMCETACPVSINTGDLVRRLRRESTGALTGAAWNTAAKHWKAVSRGGGLSLTAASALPTALPVVATNVGRRLLGADVVPQYQSELPRGGSARRPRQTDTPIAVYFPACVGTMFGPSSGGLGVTDAFLALCNRSGIELAVPDGISSMCCGTPWKSKGMARGHTTMARAVLPTLWEATGEGALPVVVDASSCTEGLDELRHVIDEAPGDYADIRVIDALELVAEHLLDRLAVTAPVGSIVLHPTCSTERRGISPLLERIARHISSDVTVPVSWGCCGFAGDRGMLHPELAESATAAEAAEVGERAYDVYASANRTCEIGMSRATDHDYVHIIETLERATRPVEVR